MSQPAPQFPTVTAPWMVQTPGGDLVEPEVFEEGLRGAPWEFPKAPVHFITDLHGDPDALVASLSATGVVGRSGELGFELTPEGERATFVFGGDSFDKGPATLELLDELAAFERCGAKVVWVAGNHDVRTVLGLRYAGAQDVLHRHLFARMGPKAVPLLAAALDRASADRRDRRVIDRDVATRLFPDAGWYDEFPRRARGRMPDAEIAREVRRVRAKSQSMREAWQARGLSLGELIAAIASARALVLDDGAPYGWYLRALVPAWRVGSLLFVHAGVDDEVATVLASGGVDALTAEYRRLIHEDPFTLYYGPLGSAFRTKYRATDWPLTARGHGLLRRAGITIIVHGHRSLSQGQRLILRDGVLNVECDTTLDRNTRARVGLAGPGGAATSFGADGTVRGASTDHPELKLFQRSAPAPA